MDDALKQLVLAVQTMAPEVWAIYLKQILVELFQYGGMVIVLVMIAVPGLKPVRTVWEEQDGMTQVTMALLVLVWGIALYGVVGEFIGRLINPEYYVIQKLLEVISGQ